MYARIQQGRASAGRRRRWARRRSSSPGTSSRGRPLASPATALFEAGQALLASTRSRGTGRPLRRGRHHRLRGRLPAHPAQGRLPAPLPQPAVLHHRRTAAPAALGALRMGIEHGGYCVGCCWALMAALFALGVMSIGWMAFIAAADRDREAAAVGAGREPGRRRDPARARPRRRVRPRQGPRPHRARLSRGDAGDAGDGDGGARLGGDERRVDAGRVAGARGLHARRVDAGRVAGARGLPCTAGRCRAGPCTTTQCTTVRCMQGTSGN